MQRYSLVASCRAKMLVTRTLLATATLALGLFAGTAAISVEAAAQDRDLLRLRDQLRDCRGDACVPLREEMMSQLRRQLESCSGGQCDQQQERLRLHEQVRDCHAAGGGRTCRQLRMQERDEIRPRYFYGRGQGQGRGMGGGGMGN
ncbi:hypothetical protein HBA54_08305 [Pelagibius litoralis]|uniref:Uncharacterized protein n=1 Tax=Pelagibius litoralis TaxID=374515 RepID=A0A967C6S3_9PROT|nr:hypothetical protein [Pelagibius litoralis]NIA68591.1 hypothetical protein [Pelagibius litoralis]